MLKYRNDASRYFKKIYPIDPSTRVVVVVVVDQLDQLDQLDHLQPSFRQKPISPAIPCTALTLPATTQNPPKTMMPQFSARSPSVTSSSNIFR